MENWKALDSKMVNSLDWSWYSVLIWPGICVQITFLLVLLSLSISGQTSNFASSKDSLREKGTNANDSLSTSDTLMHFSLPPVEIKGEYLVKKSKERKYYQLYKDIERTYPLSRIVVNEIKQVNAVLDTLYQTKAKEKAYMKKYEKQIYHTYIDTLKSLNIRQVNYSSN
jgi:hypothetical protein